MPGTPLASPTSVGIPGVDGKPAAKKWIGLGALKHTESPCGDPQGGLPVLTNFFKTRTSAFLTLQNYVMLFSLTAGHPPARSIKYPNNFSQTEPTIRSGDLLLVDRTRSRLKGNGVYLITLDDGLLVKRVEWLLDGSVVIRGDNAVVSREQRLSSTDLDKLHLLGRVVWVGSKI